MSLQEVSDRNQWDTYVADSPYGHPLQLWGWGEAKRGSGWQAVRLALVKDSQWQAAAQVLVWRIPKLGRELAYMPRGPMADSGSEAAQQILAELTTWAKERNVLYLRVEPAWVGGNLGAGWIHSKHHVQVPETYVIDLSKSLEELLEPMGRKHRQYIRKSERDGVKVAAGSSADIAAIYEIYTETAKRAGFGIHGREYYAELMAQLGSNNHLFVARVDATPVAFLWLAAAGQTAYELYGGVTAQGAEIKANYYLKWRAIQTMKEAGYQIYDFNGRLNEGVSRFKDGFGPREVDYIGTWDYPVSRLGYQAWERLWPVAKPVGRWAAKLIRP